MVTKQLKIQKFFSSRPMLCITFEEKFHQKSLVPVGQLSSQLLLITKGIISLVHMKNEKKNRYLPRYYL